MELKLEINSARAQRKIRASALKTELKTLLDNVIHYEKIYGPDVTQYPVAEADLFMSWISRAMEIKVEKEAILEQHRLDEQYDGIDAEIEKLLA